MDSNLQVDFRPLAESNPSRIPATGRISDGRGPTTRRISAIW
ncbi:MAG: hypothetical protein AB1611_18225 [bacterium]